MRAQGYTLDLYCDYLGCPDRWGIETRHWQYTGRTFSECMRQARADGWSCTNRRDVCPRCNPKAKK